jgi:hypothetical protein
VIHNGVFKNCAAGKCRSLKILSILSKKVEGRFGSKVLKSPEVCAVKANCGQDALAPVCGVAPKQSQRHHVKRAPKRRQAIGSARAEIGHVKE